MGQIRMGVESEHHEVGISTTVTTWSMAPSHDTQALAADCSTQSTLIAWATGPRRVQGFRPPAGPDTMTAGLAGG